MLYGDDLGLVYCDLLQEARFKKLRLKLLRYTSHTSHVLFLVGSDAQKVVRYTHPVIRVQTLSNSKVHIIRPRDR
jgi:hypothetical protein